MLNPPGCFLRAGLIDRMGRAGFTPVIAAEIHNMHLQLAFASNQAMVSGCCQPAFLPGTILSTRLRCCAHHLNCTCPSRSYGLD